MGALPHGLLSGGVGQRVSTWQFQRKGMKKKKRKKTRHFYCGRAVVVAWEVELDFDFGR